MLRGDDAYFGNVTEGDAEQTGMRRLSSPAMLPPTEELGYSEGSCGPPVTGELQLFEPKRDYDASNAKIIAKYICHTSTTALH